MKAILVKAIPEDLAKFVLKIQCDLKMEKGRTQLPQSQAIIHIIREYKRIIEE